MNVLIPVESVSCFALLVGNIIPWLWAVVRYWMLLARTARGRTAQNVYQIENYFGMIRKMRFFGFFVVMILLLLIGHLSFPDAYVVKDGEMRRCYVPYWYDGHRCRRDGAYYINRCGSDLVLYSVTMYDGMYVEVSSQEEFVTVPDGVMIEWPEGIGFCFEPPRDKLYYYVPDRYAGKTVVEWVIDTRYSAVQDVEAIRDRITDAQSVGMDKEKLRLILIHKMQF